MREERPSAPSHADKQHSIRRAIVRLFARAMLVLVLVVLTGTGVYLYFSTGYAIRDEGRQAAYTTYQVMDGVDLATLKESADSPYYASVRTRLHEVCQTFGMEYLYLYEPDVASQTITYILCTAADDAEDEAMARERGLGYVASYEINDHMLSALAGEREQTAWIIDNDFGKVAAWAYPLFDDAGNVQALLGVEYNAGGILGRAIAGTVAVVAVVVGALSLLLYLQLRGLDRRVFEPLALISGRMRTFVSDQDKDLEPLALNSGDEMQEIADSFDKMCVDIDAYVTEIEDMTAAQAQAEAQMDVARRIQMGMVPAWLDDEGACVQASALEQPARAVGGDFYDCFALDDGRYCAVVGDVSGKGVSAALFMVMAKTMLHDHLNLGLSPAKALNKVNDELCARNPEGMFATVFALVADGRTGEVTYANGGHNVPVVLRAAGPELLSPDPGIALGLFEDAGIVDERLTLGRGEGILLYTDGITEAVNVRDEFFGEEGLLGALKDEASWTSEAATHAVQEATQAFFAGRDQFDDMTVVTVMRTAGSSVTLELPVVVSSFTRVADVVAQRCGNTRASRKALLAFDEAWANVVNHSGATKARVTLDYDGREIALTLADNGTRFDPLTAERKERAFEELDQGGMGLGIIRRLPKQAEWTYEDGWNILKLRFDA